MNRHNKTTLPSFPKGQRRKKERMDPMKKLIALFLCLCLMAGIVPVVAESTAVTHEITSASYPFHLGATVLGEVPLYFLDGANDMPYIDAESMHAVISSVMNSATGNFNYTINIEGSIVTLTRNNLKTPGDVGDGAYKHPSQNPVPTFSPGNRPRNQGHL